MPLSTPVKRNLIHTREIRCTGYEREDGLWDIEGRITDTKTYSFSNFDRGEVSAGMPVHDMLIRLTIDADLVVQKAEALTASAPFHICPAINGNVAALKGLKITSGWRRNVQAAIGGLKGCTHISQLLTGPLATTAYQSIIPRQNQKKNTMKDKSKKKNQRPAVINTCHAFDANGENVKRIWPEFYEGNNNSK
jgi:hypothetical protein